MHLGQVRAAGKRAAGGRRSSPIASAGWVLRPLPACLSASSGCAARSAACGGRGGNAGQRGGGAPGSKLAARASRPPLGCRASALRRADPLQERGSQQPPPCCTIAGCIPSHLTGLPWPSLLQAGIQVGNACWELYCLEHG